MLIGLFLARYDREGVKALGYESFKMTFRVLSERINVPANSILIYRNKFDAFFPNTRVGFSRYFDGHLHKLEPIITLIEATKFWTFKQFVDVINAFRYPHDFPIPEIHSDAPVFEESEVKEKVTKMHLETFDQLFREFNAAFHRLFIFVEHQHDYPRLDNDSDISLSTILLEGIDKILNENQDYFEDYKTRAHSLMRFMTEYWETFNLYSSGNSVLWYADLFVFYKDICHQMNKTTDTNVINMQLNTCDVVCSYSIISLLQEAFVLLFKDEAPSLLQRYLINRAQQTILNINNGYFHSITLNLKRTKMRVFELIDILKSHNLKRFIEYFTQKQSLNQCQSCSSFSQDLNKLMDGSLKAKLAYDIFDQSTQYNLMNSGSINALTLTIPLASNCTETINGKFEITWKSMGYIAQTDNEIILAFRGSKCFEDWITNWLQLSVGPDISYQCAMGLLLLLGDMNNDSIKINVYGHSLGGGLSQFAVAAATKDGMKNIKAYCYNSAGLSDYTLLTIGEYPTENDRFTNIFHLQHKSDLIHTWDFQLGKNYYVGKNHLLKKFIKICHYHSIDTIMSTTKKTGKLILK